MQARTLGTAGEFVCTENVCVHNTGGSIHINAWTWWWISERGSLGIEPHTTFMRANNMAVIVMLGFWNLLGMLAFLFILFIECQRWCCCCCSCIHFAAPEIPTAGNYNPVSTPTSSLLFWASFQEPTFILFSITLLLFFEILNSNLASGLSQMNPTCSLSLSLAKLHYYVLVSPRVPVLQPQIHCQAGTCYIFDWSLSCQLLWHFLNTLKANVIVQSRSGT